MEHSLSHHTTVAPGILGMKCNCGKIHSYNRMGVDEMDTSEVWDEEKQDFVEAKESEQQSKPLVFKQTEWGAAKY